MNTRLLATKFHIPPWRTGAVVRARLLKRLTAGLQEQHKVTVVSAPAGYGKTTLVTGWLHSLNQEGVNMRASWLSLDEADNDSPRFWRYWLAAFRPLAESLDQTIASQLSLSQLPPVDLLLDELLNDLAALELPTLLVLDDYHVITQPQIHEALAYFINHQPAHFHLLLTTRAAPPLPLARLRARNQLTEIRTRDMRFTPAEARQFFTGSLNIPLTEDVINTLEARTEGWAAGMQLAGLALQQQSEPQRFLETFRGSHRFVLDYLAEEVIRRQGDEMRDFLIQTSILDRFTADSCRALTGRADAAVVIAHLEQANLFIVPLDDERRWYRYHHLFGEYLRSLLTPAETAALLQQAATWHEVNGLPVEAVQYALSSGNHEFAAEIVERALAEELIWSDGDLTLLLAWLDALPAAVFPPRPQLSLHAAHLLYLLGRFDLAEMRLAQAEQSQPDAPQVQAQAALYRGGIAAVRGQAAQAIEQIHFAQTRFSPDDHQAQAHAFFSLGLAYEISGQTDLAGRHYLQAGDEATTAGILFQAIHARCAAAQVQVTQGQLHLAEQSCRQAIELAGGAHLPQLGLAWSILGGIALERNELTAAELLLRDGIALARRGGLQDDLVVGLASLARLVAHQGDIPAALAAIEEVRAIIRGFGVARMDMLADAHLARLQLLAGQTEAALQWAAAYRATRSASPHEFEELTLARCLLIADDLATVPSLLHPRLKTATETGRNQTRLEVLLLLAHYHQASGDTEAALEQLERALQLAAPEGYVRLVLESAPPVLDLLPRVRQFAPEFVDALLAIRQPEHTPPTPLTQLPDPLTEQEQRVLQLILVGKSNREIAEELVITVGTAKWHVHNILQKLGVANRSQAIALGRELGI
jgi:LuxR family maltose regulon positive regulatory protein